ncbi:MAG TPA: heme-copper oxidase subunit III [Acidobacteriaceae bacterium]|nr:heme-copper oxidase subunit III [Acidobacteriaceae bacterium]
MSASAVLMPSSDHSQQNLSRGTVGMVCLILGESAIFAIFVVAYIFYIGKSLSGPTPAQILDLPIFTTICLLSSSLTIWRAEVALHHGALRRFTVWWALTILLASIFLGGTAREWQHLIVQDGFTLKTNLFGTTFYSLVGLHATHVVVGLAMMVLVLIFALMGKVQQHHAGRVAALSLYWHFVDAVWVVVFTVVYVIGR